MNITTADREFYMRQSPRSFTEESVKEEVLMKLFEAARWAPSSYNEQPWRFIYAIRNKNSSNEKFKKLFSCLSEFNQDWAKESPVLLLTSAKKNFEESGKPNPHAWHDLGLAMGNLCIQATKEGLVVHQMAGFSQEKAVELFGLPKEIEPVAMVAIGYADSYKMDRERKPLHELIIE